MRIVQIRSSDALKRFSYYVCNGLTAMRLHHCAAKIRIIFEKRSFGELIFVIFSSVFWGGRDFLGRVGLVGPVRFFGWGG